MWSAEDLQGYCDDVSAPLVPENPVTRVTQQRDQQHTHTPETMHTLTGEEHKDSTSTWNRGRSAALQKPKTPETETGQDRHRDITKGTIIITRQELRTGVKHAYLSWQVNHLVPVCPAHDRCLTSLIVELKQLFNNISVAAHYWLSGYKAAVSVDSHIRSGNVSSVTAAGCRLPFTYL